MKRLLTAALPGLAVLLVTLPAAAEPPEGWCVVLGGFPYDQLDKATATAEKARATLPQTAVYDTRDLPELAWGELVVIAERKTDQKEASAIVKAAKKTRLDAFAKPCGPLGKAIAVKADLKPLPTLGTTPVTFDAASLPGGCFGWSSKRKAAACILGASTLQEGGTTELAILGEKAETLTLMTHKGLADGGDFDQVSTVSEATRARAEKLLTAGAFVALTDGRDLAPRGMLHWATPRFSVRHTRTATPVREVTGSWVDATDTIEVRCGGAKAAWTAALVSDNHAIEEDLTMAVLAIPGTSFALITLTNHWGIEGDHGQSTLAAVVNMETCLPLDAPAPTP